MATRSGSCKENFKMMGATNQAKEEATTKQKTDFMMWTNEVNKRANLKDYLPQEPQQEEPPPSRQKTNPGNPL